MFRFYPVFAFVLVALLSTGQLSAQADIWMKDCNADVGNEPNTDCPLTNHCASTGCNTYILWRSVDIWNRKTPDTNHDPSLIFPHSNPPTTEPHENPVYRPLIDAQPNYLYVRVRNRGNQPTTGTERLRVYWSKAGTGLDWPSDWVDNMDTVCGPNKLYGIEITKPRKSAARATPAERDAFIAAIHAIDTDPLYRYLETNNAGGPPGVSWWDIQDMLHENSMGKMSEHQNPAFLPWHREFINRYELALRTANPLVRCLYWDYTEDPNPRNMDDGNGGTFNLLNDDFMGGDAGSLFNAVEIGVSGGNNFNDLYFGSGGAGGAQWRSSGPGLGNHAGCADDSCYLLPPQFIVRGTRTSDFINGPVLTNGSSGLLDDGSYPAHRQTNENSLHGNLHGHSSGNQCCPNTTVEDPMFFTGIHVPCDKFWAMWQRDRAHLSNPDLSRINPDTAYGSSGSTDFITDDLHPWDGKLGQTLAAANVYPWDTKPVYKSSAHPSVVYPPIYDGAPLTIPPLEPGKCIIIEIPWYPPNPEDYDCSALQNPKGHVCVLARIEEDENAPFGMTTPEIQSVYQNTKNNNNIAWKNMDVVQPSGITGTNVSELIVANPFPRLRPFRFELDPVGHLDLDDTEGRRLNIFNFGRVKLHLGDELFARWEEGGRIGMGGGEPRVVFEDDFNRANGVLADWAPRSDRWQVVRNELVGSGIVSNNFNQEPYTFAPFELPESFELEFDLRFTTTPDGVGRHGGIMFCAQENNRPRIASTSYTLDWIDNEPNTRVRGLRLSKNRVDADLGHREARLGVHQQRNPPGHWKIVVNPEGIVAYGDGEEMGRSEDSGYRGGYLGFWTFGNGTRIAVDNLQVRTLGGGETMVEIERQGVLALDCPSRTPWRGSPAIGINLAGNETRMIAVEFELDENYLEQGRNFLATRPLEYHLIQTGADGEAIGGQTYVVDLSKLTLVPGDSDWRYRSRRSAPGGWTQVDYNDNDWESGPADLGYGDKQQTLIGIPPEPKISTVHSYFRHQFTLSRGDINAISNLWLRLKVDDGADVYLNGVLIHRRNMAEEGQRPLRPVEGLEEDTYFPVDITEHRDLLIPDDANVLAVSVHNHPEGDNDLTFNLELLANHLNTDEPTVIAIQQPADGAYYELGDTIPISAEAIDPDGEENPRISYEVNGQPLRLIAGARPSFTPTTPGVYKLRAGCSNNPATHTVTISVITNLPPKVELTLPGGHMFDEGEPIILRAEVEDTDDVSVRFTAFLMNDLFVLQADLPDDGEEADGLGRQLGVDDTAPYEAMVNDLPPGHWAFLAIALDARGGVTTGRMGMANVMATQVPPGGWQVPGDFTQNGSVDLTDSVALLQWQFMGGPGPDCPPGAEFNGDGNWDISDAVAGLQWLFVGGRPHHLGIQCQPILTCPDACNP